MVPAPNCVLKVQGEIVEIKVLNKRRNYILYAALGKIINVYHSKEGKISLDCCCIASLRCQPLYTIALAQLENTVS